MDELIVVIPNEYDEKGEICEVIYELDKSVSNKIAEFERQIKAIKEKEDELKQAILEEMEKKNIIKIDTEDLLISYVAPTTRETLDSKTFKNDMPEIYDEYVKITPVKSSIRIKLK